MREETYKQKSLSYLVQIRNHLWLQKAYGKAAVMIGSGFSRNALANTTDTPPFPLWKDLAQTFHLGLSPDTEFSEASSPLELAGRYEARFGRTALNKLLAKQIPDDSYQPGPLHVSLLELPWADLFTTNYDTLLERTTIHLPPERDYSVVRTIEAIAGSNQPRITKLHGSFPDCLPLIITEEDYRTYPDRFAPLVNMVQQSMMENVFCLLGFGGDDPNFLAWTGWVRDNLKNTAPRIYLCGMFAGLEESRIDYLERRNIAIVDLSVLTTGESHSQSLEAFFRFLKDGKPEDPLQWSNKSNIKTSSESESESVESCIFELRKLIKSYPGWVVCPQAIRKRFWEKTLKPVLQQPLWNDGFNSLALETRIKFIRDCVWGLNVCLFPLFEPLLEYMTSVIKEYFLEPNDLLKNDVIELLFALVRYAREEHDEELHKNALTQLEGLIADLHDNSETGLRLHYEKCLSAWYRLRYDDLETLIRAWPSGNPRQFWETKKASLLLILGQSDAAWHILEGALSTIRHRLHKQNENVELLSQEAWTMFLLDSRDLNKLGNRSQEFRGRWVSLAKYGCDPIQELDKIEMDRPEGARPERIEKEGFDPGQTSVSIGMGDIGGFERYLHDCSILRIHEEAAFPIRFGIHIGLKDAISDLFLDMLARRPSAALGLAMRFRHEEITNQLSRLRVAGLPQNEIEFWVRDIFTLLKIWVRQLPLEQKDHFNPDPWNDLLGAALEIISRLTIRITEESVCLFFTVICELYKSPTVRLNHSLYGPIKNSLNRCIAVLPKDTTTKDIVKLLNLPVGDADGSHVALLELWPEPFDFVKYAEQKEWTPSNEELPVVRSRVGFLLDQVLHGNRGNGKNRIRAIQRLWVLHRIGALTIKEKKKYAEAIWSCKDQNTGLPNLESAYPLDLVLFLPENNTNKAERKLKDYLLGVNIVELAGTFSESKVRTYPPTLVVNLKRIIRAFNDATAQRWHKCVKQTSKILLKWDDFQAHKLITDVVQVWENQKEEAKLCQNVSLPLFGGKSETLRLFLDLSTLMTKTMLPYLAEPKPALKSSIRNTLQEMLEYGIPVQRNLHMLFIFDDIDFDWIFSELIKGIKSNDHFISGNSFVGVRDWAYMAYGKKKKYPNVPDQIRNDIVGLSLTLDTKAKETLLYIDAQLVKDIPDFFSSTEKDLLVLALESISSSALNPIKEKVKSTNSQSMFTASHALAAALYADYCKRNEKVPEGLSWWRSSLTEIPLPEVQDSWASVLEGPDGIN